MGGFMGGISDDESKMGIMPRVVRDIFEYIEGSTTEHVRHVLRASYIELYKEELRDLLEPNKPSKVFY